MMTTSLALMLKISIRRWDNRVLEIGIGGITEILNICRVEICKKVLNKKQIGAGFVVDRLRLKAIK